MLRLGERRDVIFVPRPTDAASLAFLLLGVEAFAAAVPRDLSALLTERDKPEGGRAPKEIGGRAFLCRRGPSSRKAGLSGSLVFSRSVLMRLTDASL